MGMIVRCNYCSWIGIEPSTAEYDTQEEYEAAFKAFRDSHDDPEQNTCPENQDN